MMVSPKAAEAPGEKFGTEPVCAGPFSFVERVAQDRIVVERFADYWDRDKILIDQIVFRRSSIRPCGSPTCRRGARSDRAGAAIDLTAVRETTA